MAEDPPDGGGETRPQQADTGAAERVYAVAFGRVWLAALAAAAAMRRWTVTGSNSVRGEIFVDVRGLLSKTTRAVHVRIALDDVGLTRVNAVFVDPGGRRAEGVEPAQIERFHRQLDALLRRDARK